MAKEPDFWNGGAMLGSIAGTAAGVAGATALLNAATHGGVLAAVVNAWHTSLLGGSSLVAAGGLQGALAAAGAPMLIGAAAIAIAAIAIGTIVGGKIGQAIKQHDSDVTNSQSASHDHAHNIAHSMEHHMGHGAEKSWVESLAAQQNRASEQSAARI